MRNLGVYMGFLASTQSFVTKVFGSVANASRVS